MCKNALLETYQLRLEPRWVGVPLVSDVGDQEAEDGGGDDLNKYSLRSFPAV